MLANKLIEKEDWSHYIHTDSEASSIGRRNRALDPLLQATRLGILEVVMAILNKYPEAADSFDEMGGTYYTYRSSKSMDLSMIT
ncbi:hypothetical protein CsSME_00025309 [Camellia sinensis var. sinensis]